jgi:hypothetical protein
MATDKDTLRESVEALSKTAFDQAVVRWQRKTPFAEDMVSELRRLKEELRHLAIDLRQTHPDLHRTLSNTISEALLDFKYAIDAPLGTSIRLHHYIERQEARENST